jgi:hypothetical protein
MFSSAWIRLKDHSNRATLVRIKEILFKANCDTINSGTTLSIASKIFFKIFQILIFSRHKTHIQIRFGYIKLHSEMNDFSSYIMDDILNAN